MHCIDVPLKLNNVEQVNAAVKPLLIPWSEGELNVSTTKAPVTLNTADKSFGGLGAVTNINLEISIVP